MINEERVILMTKLASYEEHEGKRNMKIINYFRSDYIALQVLKSVFSATVAFALLFALYIFYDFEVIMQDIYKMDLIGFAKTVLTYYGITVLVYGLISYFICAYKYSKARRSLRAYQHNLKKLHSLYEER
ncbi:MAG: hypothetical protein IJ794_19235 [Lachnospiraceae bacterium]|nr:hypothetical protein [Lachnospiraceae bacterium]